MRIDYFVLTAKQKEYETENKNYKRQLCNYYSFHGIY